MRLLLMPRTSVKMSQSLGSTIGWLNWPPRERKKPSEAPVVGSIKRPAMTPWIVDLLRTGEQGPWIIERFNHVNRCPLGNGSGKRYGN